MRRLSPNIHKPLLTLLLALPLACSGADPSDTSGDGDTRSPGGDGDVEGTGQGAGTSTGAVGAGAANGVGANVGAGAAEGTGASNGSGGIGATTGGDGDGDSGNECVPVVDRCDCVVAADGVNTLIDAFEDADLRINVIDSRDGEWFQATGRQSGTPLGTLAVESGALHMTGGPTTLSPPTGQPDDWATFGVPLGQCYDASPYAGLKFRIRGNTASGNNSVRFSISTPPTTEVAAGGTCPDGDLGCYNHFGKTIILTDSWQEVTASWAELQQSPSWGIKAPPGYAKQQHIMAVNFAPLENDKGYDFWIDDVAFTTATGGSCADLISESKFNALFPSKNSFYTYAGFAEAAAQFPAFCGEGSADDRLRDAAAVFAHTIQETGGNVADPTSGLFHIEEINKSPYCDAARTDFPCAAGKQYFGRGPLQLTWNYNYGTAGQALGLPFLTQPELVSATSANAFKAALWFWMTRQPLESPHTAIVTGKGFGQTIRLINGPLECDGAAPTKTANRVAAFQHFASQLGVYPGSNLDCQ